jgi:hypothetical protein
MAFNPKQILGAVANVGKGAVSLVGRPLRRGERRTDSAPTTPASSATKTSGPPSTVGAAQPGAPGGHKSATAPKAKRRAKPAKRATASRAAASSGKDVADAASRPND